MCGPLACDAQRADRHLLSASCLTTSPGSSRRAPSRIPDLPVLVLVNAAQMVEKAYSASASARLRL